MGYTRRHRPVKAKRGWCQSCNGVDRPSTSSCRLHEITLLLPVAMSMARYLPFVARAFGVGAVIVIVAIISRQVYLRIAAEAADADEEPATMMLIRCETMHERLQNRHRSDAEVDERPRARCRES